MIREILALGLSNDKERIGVKTALCFGLMPGQPFVFPPVPKKGIVRWLKKGHFLTFGNMSKGHF